MKKTVMQLARHRRDALWFIRHPLAQVGWSVVGLTAALALRSWPAIFGWIFAVSCASQLASRDGYGVRMVIRRMVFNDRPMGKLFVLLVLLLPLTVHAQTPGTTSYPTSLDGSVSLPVSADAKVTFLTASATNSVTTFTVNSTTGFPSSGVLLMPSGELVAYTGTSSTTFTGLTRGFSGTTAQAYSVNQTVRLSLSAAYVNGSRGAAVALETKIGIDGSGGTATPTNVDDVLMVTASGATKWKPLPTSSAYTPGGTDVAVADGGTGASTASGARTNLGLVIGTDIEAHDPDLTTIAGLTPTTDNFIVSVSSAWASRTPAQVKTTLSLNNVANVDTTNAANISSGTLPAGRMPALTGDCTTSAGAVATTCTKINGVDQIGAWTTYTPTVAAGSGTFTTVSGVVYYQITGKKATVRGQVVITTNGTAATYITVSMPAALNIRSTEIAQAGTARVEETSKTCTLGITSGTWYLHLYDGTYPGGSGRTIDFSAVIELN